MSEPGGSLTQSRAWYVLASCLERVLSQEDFSNLRATCRGWRDAVDATLLCATARVGEPPAAPRWEHWLSLRRLVLTVPRVWPADGAWLDQDALVKQAAALGLHRLPAVPPGGFRHLELDLAAPRFGCPATSLRRLHHALAAAGALARFSTVAAAGPAQVDSSFGGRLVAAEVRLDTYTPHLPGQPAGAFARLERLTLVVSRRAQQAALQRWLAADTLPRCAELILRFVSCPDDLTPDDARDNIEDWRKCQGQDELALGNVQLADACEVLQQLSLAALASACEAVCPIVSSFPNLPLLLLLPSSPPDLRTLLTRPVLPLGLLHFAEVRQALLQRHKPAVPTRAAVPAGAASRRAPQRRQLGSARDPPPVPRLLSQLRALELADVQPAGGLATLTGLTKLTRLRLPIIWADHECGYGCGSEGGRAACIAALGALPALECLSVHGLLSDEGLARLQGLTELHVQQSPLMDMWADGVGQGLLGLTALQRLSMRAFDFHWEKNRKGYTQQLLHGALATLTRLRQLVLSDWHGQARTWHGFCAQLVKPVLTIAPGLQLLHLPRAILYQVDFSRPTARTATAPCTTAGCLRLVDRHGTTVELRWRLLEPARWPGGRRMTGSNHWDIFVKRAEPGTLRQTPLKSMGDVLGSWPDSQAIFAVDQVAIDNDDWIEQGYESYDSWQADQEERLERLRKQQTHVLYHGQ